MVELREVDRLHDEARRLYETPPETSAETGALILPSPQRTPRPTKPASP
jgi:hypothetical protein